MRTRCLVGGFFAAWAASVSPAAADPAATLVYAADIDRVSALAAEYFGATIAADLRDDLTAAADPAPPIVSPFDDQFVPLQAFSAAGLAMARAWEAMADNGERRGRFAAFLGAINAGDYVRGVARNPGFGGCIAVAFALGEDAGRVALHENWSDFAFDGCPRTYRSFGSSSVRWLD